MRSLGFPRLVLAATILVVSLAGIPAVADSHAGEEGDDETVVLSGHVYDAVDGDPLTDVQIEAFDRTAPYTERDQTNVGTTTSEDGSFSLELPYRSVALDAVAPGYMNVSLGFDIGAERSIASLDIWQPRERSASVNLSGSVTEPDGDPVTGAEVRVTPNMTRPLPNVPDPEGEGIDLGREPHLMPPASQAPDGETVTDEDGRWNMTVHPGGIEITASLDGYTDAREHRVAEADMRDIELVMGPSIDRSLALEGKIVDERTGDPIANATLRNPLADVYPSNRETTTEDGRFTFHVRPNTGRLIVTGPNGTDDAYARWSGFYDGRPEETIETTIGLTPVSMLTQEPTGSVTTQAWVLGPYGQRPVPGALIEAEHIGTGETACTVTDDGDVSLHGPPGLYELTVTGNPNYRVTHTATVDEDGTDPLGLRVVPPHGPEAEGLSCPSNTTHGTSLELGQASLDPYEPGDAREPSTLTDRQSNATPGPHAIGAVLALLIIGLRSRAGRR